MKKFLRITAALAAVFAMVNFVACKDDDDDDDNGNGFENTYWVLEDDVDDEEGYTVSAEQYVYIKDSSTGTMYGADSEKVWEAVYELVGAGVTDSKTFEYTQKADFTYAIEGSSIKITYKDEAGNDVNVTATVAEDKTSFSLTNKDEETGEEYTMTYKKAAAAPKAATVTYTVKTTGETPTEKVLAVEYDLASGLPTDITSTDAFVSADWAVPTATPVENDITWTWVATTTRKVKSNTGLQVSNGTSAENIITLSADGNFTVTLTYKFAGDYVAGKVRCLTINGENVDSMTETTDKTKDYTYTTAAAKSVTIGANGMKLTKIVTAPAE